LAIESLAHLGLNGVLIIKKKKKFKSQNDFGSNLLYTLQDLP